MTERSEWYCRDCGWVGLDPIVHQRTPDWPLEEVECPQCHANELWEREILINHLEVCHGDDAR